MSDRDAVRVESFTTELSVALGLVDGLTGGPPIGDPDVSVTNADHDFERTPSGYFVLVDLPADPSTLEVHIESTAYLTEERSIAHGSLPADDPLVEVTLVPGPAYPFGGGETLVRGLVEDTDGPVGDAQVEYVEGTATTRTNDRGDYALRIGEITSGNVGTDTDGNRVLKPGGNNPTIRVTHPDGRTSDVKPTVPIGGTAIGNVSF